MGNNQSDLIPGLLFFLVILGLGLWMISQTRTHIQTRSFQLKLFLIAMLVRFLAALAIYEFGLSNVIGDEDSSGYFLGRYYGGLWIGQNRSFLELPSLWAPAFEEHHRGYYYLVGTLFFLTGWTGRIPPAALNCFFGAMTVVFTYRISRSLFSNWTSVRVGWLVCFIPSMIIWSCQTLKEPVVIFMETVALYSCIRLRQAGFDLKYILLCIAAMFLLYPFRFYASLVTGLAIFVTFLLPELGKRAGSARFAGLAIVILVVPLAISSGLAARSESQIEQFDIDRIQQFRVDIARGQGSGVESNFDMKTPAGFTLATAIGALHLLLAPFPWQLGGSLRMVFTFPEMLLWWWLFFAGLLPGLWYAIRNRLFEVMPALVFIFILGLLYSMTFGNVGLVFRQRAQILPWLLIFTVLGFEIRKLKKLNNFGFRSYRPGVTLTPRH
jgi:hypothetical protein